MPRDDPNSYANISEVKYTHIALDLTADFERSIVHGSATLTLSVGAAGRSEVVLDTRDLAVEGVELVGDGVLAALTVGLR